MEHEKIAKVDEKLDENLLNLDELIAIAEEELIELLLESKRMLAKIENIDNFSKSVYTLMLSTLIKIERENKTKSTVEEHSTLEFSLQNDNGTSKVHDLIFLNNIKNMPTKLDLSNEKKNFFDEYLDIIAEYSTTKTNVNFDLSNMDVYTFFYNITMLLKNNKNLDVRVDYNVRTRTIITISLNFKDSSN